MFASHSEGHAALERQPQVAGGHGARLALGEDDERVERVLAGRGVQHGDPVPHCELIHAPEGGSARARDSAAGGRHGFLRVARGLHCLAARPIEGEEGAQPCREFAAAGSPTVRESQDLHHGARRITAVPSRGRTPSALKGGIWRIRWVPYYKPTS